MPKIFLLSFSIPAILFDDPFGLLFLLTSPFLLQYLKAIKSSFSSLSLTQNGTLVFEGSTDDANETTLTVADPTADRTITLPDVTGTVITSGDTDTVTKDMLKSLVTLQILNSSGSVLKTIYGAGA